MKISTTLWYFLESLEEIFVTTDSTPNISTIKVGRCAKKWPQTEIMASDKNRTLLMNGLLRWKTRQCTQFASKNGHYIVFASLPGNGRKLHANALIFPRKPLTFVTWLPLLIAKPYDRPARLNGDSRFRENDRDRESESLFLLRHQNLGLGFYQFNWTLRGELSWPVGLWVVVVVERGCSN